MDGPALPVMASISRSSPREMTRTMPMKARKNGMPMMSVARLIESAMPATAIVKHTMPVAKANSMKKTEVEARGSEYTLKKRRTSPAPALRVERAAARRS
jgi:hypothetical protein